VTRSLLLSREQVRVRRRRGRPLVVPSGRRGSADRDACL
jgi:hypothetical protein